MDTGVLLPIGSLPRGRFSDGYAFVDYLAKHKHKYWQILPLSPRDSFGSPYNSPNSLKIDPGYGTKSQWLELKKYANAKGIKIIGDVPYFITPQEKKDLFLKGLYAGAPPDVYSKKGQYWGLPVYNWKDKFDQNLKYLLQRLEQATKLYDVIRLDHFRGYCALWVVPKPYKSGRRGHWLPVPGSKIMKKVREEFPKTTFIAENLGVITPRVESLRKKQGFLGSKVLLWHKVSSVKKDEVLYTSVHDSNTLLGEVKSQKKVQKLLSQAQKSRAKILMWAMQDILGLGSSARLNKPGKKGGNWKWRLSDDDLRTG